MFRILSIFALVAASCYAVVGALRFEYEFGAVLAGGLNAFLSFLTSQFLFLVGLAGWSQETSQRAAYSLLALGVGSRFSLICDRLPCDLWVFLATCNVCILTAWIPWAPERSSWVSGAVFWIAVPGVLVLGVLNDPQVLYACVGALLLSTLRPVPVCLAAQALAAATIKDATVAGYFVHGMTCWLLSIATYPWRNHD